VKIASCLAGNSARYLRCGGNFFEKHERRAISARETGQLLPLYVDTAVYNRKTSLFFPGYSKITFENLNIFQNKNESIIRFSGRILPR
jgi:hypothetical protein